MSTAYSITFVNNSNQNGSACLYQHNLGYAPNVLSLAWFTRPAFPSSSAMFSWTMDYSFFWAQTGSLMPGIQVNPGQTVPADTQNSNSIMLSSSQQSGFQFTNQQPGYQPGSFSINSESTVPVNTASIGIGMAGSGTFAVQAQPNMINIFTPVSSYWITFGNYQQGQALNTSSIANAVEVSFPGNVYAMKVTLNPDGSFTVQQG